MKKVLKILIVLIIIFIVIISAIYYFKSHRKFKFTITDIDNDSITGAYLIPDIQTVEYSSFNFYNENGQKLEFSDLSVGNIVYCGNLKDYCFERIRSWKQNRSYMLRRRANLQHASRHILGRILKQCNKFKNY